MFSQALSVILRTLDARRAPMPRVPEAAALNATREARRALSHDLRVPPLSERMEEPKLYRALMRERRRDLEALLLADVDDGRRALDLICALCEESSWAAEAQEPFEDEKHPQIDLQAADTAALLGWAWRVREDALSAVSPRIYARMRYEVDRRVIRPLIAHEDYVCSPAALCGAVTALLLLEEDRDRLGATLRPLLRQLDAACACAETARAPLEERLADATALADLAHLLRKATVGAVDLTRSVPSSAMLDELLFGHIQEDWFFTCTRGACRPGLSGAALYRLGRFCGDGALRSLGAALCGGHTPPSPTVTGRLWDVSLREALDGEIAAPPRLKHAALEDGRLMVARGAGFFCGLTSGGNCANAGDICVFLERACVLSGGNLPLEQLPRPVAEPMPDWDFSDQGRALMSVDVTPAYAPEALVRAHQRTLMLSRDEYGAQLVDVFDLDAPRELCYRFHSPFMPEFSTGGARLGPMFLTWEGEPAADARRAPATDDFPEGQWELTLRYPPSAQRVMFTFFMRRA